MTAELCMLIAGSFSFLLTLHWLRSRDLREKYAVGWLLVAFVLFLTALFPGAIMTMARFSGLSYPAAVLFVALAVIYVFAFSVSVGLTRQHRAGNKLMQQIGLLEERLRRLEKLSKKVPENDAASTREERIAERARVD